MIRVVADTNIYISALMFDGLPGIFLDLAFQRAFTLISSRVLLDELDEKLLGKFPMTTADVRAVRAKLESTAQIVAPDFTFEVISADPDDNPCARMCSSGQR
jgi:uncharacterized protein